MISVASHLFVEIKSDVWSEPARLKGYIRIVVRNLAANVVDDVGLGDTVGSMSADPAHDAAAVTEQASVEGGQGSTLEGEFGSTVVGQERVGVLQEGNHDEPVVNPAIPH
jgi:hypothetical protein